jgi:hypothetical protein
MNDCKRDQVCRSGHDENGDVAAGELKQESYEGRDEHSADGSSETADAYDGRNGVAGEHVGRKCEEIR